MIFRWNPEDCCLLQPTNDNPYAERKLRDYHRISADTVELKVVKMVTSFSRVVKRHKWGRNEKSNSLESNKGIDDLEKALKELQEAIENQEEDSNREDDEE